MPNRDDHQPKETPATIRSRRASAVAFAVALVGWVWIGLTVWAAEHAREPSIGTIAAAALTIALGLSLGGTAWLFLRLRQSHTLVPLLAASVTWAGLAAQGSVDPSDALAVAAAIVAVALFAWAPRTLGPIGVVVGTAVALSPLLVGVWAGACVALPKGRARRTFVFGTVLGLVAMTAVGALTGRAPWEAVGYPVILGRVGPAAFWRHLAGVLDLVAPLLVLGVLGALARHGDSHADGSACDPCAKDPAPVPFALGILRVWFWFNVAVAIALPKTSAGHVLVMTVPAVLLAASGWGELRRLTSRATSLPIALTGGVCLFLILVLLWTPLRAGGECLVIALWPPA